MFIIIRQKTIYFLFLKILFSSSLLFASDFKIEINSQKKFILKDSPAFSSITTKDDNWQTINFKKERDIPEYKFGTGIGWFRIIFSGKKLQQTEKLGLYLGRIGDSDEAYLNDIKIGGEGKIGDDFIEATNIVRLYPIPENLINFAGNNLLAIRIMNTSGSGGFQELNPIIGDYKSLFIEKMLKNKTKDSLDIFL